MYQGKVAQHVGHVAVVVETVTNGERLIQFAQRLIELPEAVVCHG